MNEPGNGGMGVSPIGGKRREREFSPAGEGDKVRNMSGSGKKEGIGVPSHTEKITFCGFCEHLDDLTFDHVIVDESFSNVTLDQMKRYHEKIVWNDSGIPDDDEIEKSKDDMARKKKRWLRILSNLEKAVEVARSTTDEMIAIFDSDIVIPHLDDIEIDNFIYTPCYWLWYDWAGETRPFCSGTNFIFSRKMLDFFDVALSTYSVSEGPIDIFLHDRLPHINVLVDGTIHWVKTPNGVVKMTMTFQDLPIVRRHIPEFVRVMF